MRYSEVDSNNYQRSLPKIENNEITLKWTDNWFEGPLDGVLEYNGSLYRYEPIDKKAESSEKWYRRFIVIKLTVSQIQNEIFWHEKFLREVGNFSGEFRDVKKNKLKKTSEEIKSFYEDQQKNYTLDLGENQVIGWFQL